MKNWQLHVRLAAVALATSLLSTPAFAQAPPVYGGTVTNTTSTSTTVGRVNAKATATAFAGFNLYRVDFVLGDLAANGTFTPRPMTTFPGVLGQNGYAYTYNGQPAGVVTVRAIAYFTGGRGGGASSAPSDSSFTIR